MARNELSFCKSKSDKDVGVLIDSSISRRMHPKVGSGLICSKNFEIEEIRRFSHRHERAFWLDRRFRSGCGAVVKEAAPRGAAHA
jgi:hypothetical protein